MWALGGQGPRVEKDEVFTIALQSAIKPELPRVAQIKGERNRAGKSHSECKGQEMEGTCPGASLRLGTESTEQDGIEAEAGSVQLPPQRGVLLEAGWSGLD